MSNSNACKTLPPSPSTSSTDAFRETFLRRGVAVAEDFPPRLIIRPPEVNISEGLNLALGIQAFWRHLAQERSIPTTLSQFQGPQGDIRDPGLESSPEAFLLRSTLHLEGPEGNHAQATISSSSSPDQILALLEARGAPIYMLDWMMEVLRVVCTMCDRSDLVHEWTEEFGTMNPHKVFEHLYAWGMQQRCVQEVFPLANASQGTPA